MLTLARECRGLTQSTLSQDVSISQGDISKFETGMKAPSEDQAKRLARRLTFPLEFFYTTETSRSFGSGCVYHRKRQTASETKLRQLLALVNVRRMQIKQLLLGVNPKNEFSFEKFDLDDYQNDPRKVAQALRSMWKLPPGPVQSVIQAIENAGGIIMECEFGTDRIDALSQWLPGLPPIFLVNNRIPADRMRFTLMHEVGHICMHEFPTDDMERQADEFSSEFLMPERDIKPYLRDMSLTKLAQLKPHWRVAMSALLKRASDLGMMTPRTKQYLWTQMGMRGFRKHEPVVIPREKATLLSELLDFHSNSLGHTADEIARIMRIDIGELRENFVRPGGQLLQVVN
ncbi:MAG TPA: XRE family transcriptional regulator [Candidatus Acidoferrales bacterium]|nr:XRE family transcriptional regulator [Candidatus Acidoferrales bacterium]